MITPKLPEIRQVVLLTSDLEASLAQARRDFEVPEGHRDVDGMAAIGFVHEVFGFGRTYVEICQPSDPDSRLGQKAATADSGFMVVVQVDDRDAMVKRAAELDIEPLFLKDHNGSPISQWHPRDFGTIAEIDEMKPRDSWHFAPEIFDARSTSVVEDIVAVHLAVADPIEMAHRWAVVLGIESDGPSVEVGDRSLNFSTVEGSSNVYRVDCRATDRDRVGETVELCSVTFALV